MTTLLELVALAALITGLAGLFLIAAAAWKDFRQ